MNCFRVVDGVGRALIIGYQPLYLPNRVNAALLKYGENRFLLFAGDLHGLAQLRLGKGLAKGQLEGRVNGEMEHKN